MTAIVRWPLFLVSVYLLTQCFLIPPPLQKLISPGGNIEEGFEARGRIIAVVSFVDASEAQSFDFGSIFSANIAGIEPQNLYRRSDIDRCIRKIYLYGPLINNILNYKESVERQKEEGKSSGRASITGGTLAAGLCDVSEYSERSELSYP